MLVVTNILIFSFLKCRWILIINGKVKWGLPNLLKLLIKPLDLVVTNNTKGNLSEFSDTTL